MRHIIFGLFALALSTPLFVQAETVVRVGQDISVETSQIINGDYYVSVGPFGRTSMSGAVRGDMLTLAGSAIINGTVGGDVLAAAGTVQLQASTTDDVRILAGEAVISESVGGDVLVMAGTLRVLSSANIAGNVYFFGGDAVIDGTVGGSVYGTAERMRIDGTVGSAVDVTVPAGLTLGDAARIAGNLTYTSPVPLQRGAGSVIDGEVLERGTTASDARSVARSVLTPLFVILFASLSLFLLFKRGLQGLVERIDESLLIATGVGAATFFGAPIVGLLLMVTVLGMVLGIMTIGSLIVLYALSFALAGVVLGAFIVKYARGRLEVTLPSILVGTVVLHALMFLPGIGFVAVAFVFLVTLGGLTRTAYAVLHTRAE